MSVGASEVEPLIGDTEAALMTYTFLLTGLDQSKEDLYRSAVAFSQNLRERSRDLDDLEVNYGRSIAHLTNVVRAICWGLEKQQPGSSRELVEQLTQSLQVDLAGT